MRQEHINNIIGSAIYTDSGINVAIGNANHQTGDYIWTDGGCAFGTQISTYIPPYLPSSGNGFFDFSGNSIRFNTIMSPPVKTRKLIS